MLKNIFIVLFLSALNVDNSLASCSNPSKADILLKEMYEKYQSSLKYSDKGHVKEIINGIEYIKEFSTQFEAPDTFSFQWSKPDLITKEINTSKIWGENQIAYYLRHYDTKPEKMSINKALSSATGVSGGVSYKVLPWLLLHHDPCITINLTKNTLLSESNYQRDDSYIIQRINKRGTIYKYWVTKEKLLLLKIETKSSYKGRDFSDTISFEQVVYE
ncbi:MAG: hypothetical protein OQK98_11530 [Gammaproteobacteria bacterium]|nr:hypothetical protein [Gammaproteobacteria bacterium]